jgi:hypothetical protein
MPSTADVLLLTCDPQRKQLTFQISLPQTWDSVVLHLVVGQALGLAVTIHKGTEIKHNELWGLLYWYRKVQVVSTNSYSQLLW